MFKFRDFINILRNSAKSVFARIFSKFKYLAKQFILTESPDHVLLNYIKYVNISTV